MKLIIYQAILLTVLSFLCTVKSAFANGAQIKSFQIGFCYDCSEGQLKTKAKSWGKPHSNPNTCEPFFSGPECRIDAESEPEKTIVYLLDPVKNSRNKFEVLAYSELPSWQLFVSRANILPEEHEVMRELELHRSEYIAGLQALTERGHSLLPDELSDSSVMNDMPFLMEAKQDIFAVPKPEVVEPSLEADIRSSAVVDCESPGSKSIFYNLFLDNRRGLDRTTLTAENFLNQNYPKGVSYGLKASLGTSGVIRALGVQGEASGEYKSESMKELKSWELFLDEGRQGSLVFDVRQSGTPAGIISYRLEFNERWSKDSDGKTIRDRKTYYNRFGDAADTTNPCDAQALAKLMAESREFNNHPAGGGSIGHVTNTPQRWQSSSRCNNPPIRSRDITRYRYRIEKQSDGSIWIRVHTSVTTVVERIPCHS